MRPDEREREQGQGRGERGPGSSALASIGNFDTEGAADVSFSFVDPTQTLLKQPPAEEEEEEEGEVSHEVSF